METITNCPNCGNSIKDESQIFPENAVELINKYAGGTSNFYCLKCGKQGYLKGYEIVLNERSKYDKLFMKVLPSIPAISLNNPQNWEYDIINVVSGHIAIGLGIFGDFGTDLTNLTGGKSSDIDIKLNNAENYVLNQLKRNACNIGGNSVIGVHFCYSEFGGKGLIMVAGYGTSIKLKNIDILGERRSKDLEEINKIANDLVPLLKYKYYKV